MRRSQPQLDPPQAAALARVVPHVPAWLIGMLLVVGTVLAYQPVWHAGFIWDDDAMVTANPLVTSGGSGLRDIWASTKFHDCVPLTLTALWVEWRLWGDDPLGYHLVNVLLHAFNAVLVWRVLKRLSIPGAALAAALFALHPTNVESVAWIAEGKNTLAMFYYLLSVLLYLRSEDERNTRMEDRGSRMASSLSSILNPPSSLHYCLSLLAFESAMLSKAAVAPLPMVLLGLTWWRLGTIRAKDLWRSVPFFALAAGTALVSMWFQYIRGIGASMLDVQSGSVWVRLALAGWAFWFYLYKAVLPVGLCFVYPRWQIEPARLLSYVPGLLVGVTFAVCWFSRRGWGRATLFGLGYFLIMLLPAMGLVKIYFMRFSFVSDHWQYFAIVGPLALIAATIAGGGTTTGMANQGPRVAASAVLILVLGALTWKQSHIYQNQETLWRDTLRKNPASWMAHINLGNVLGEQGQVDEAISQYQEALRLQPNNADAHYNLGTCLLNKGRLDDAINQFQEALRVQSDHVNAHVNLGLALLQKGRLTEAISMFQGALRLKSNHILARYQLALALERNGQLDEAIGQFQEILGLQPDHADAKDRLAKALEQKRRLNLHKPQSSAREGLNGALCSARTHPCDPLKASPNERSLPWPYRSRKRTLVSTMTSLMA
jgi:Tfp pilus assembly protein PilF